jgi:predicted TIM-barrel fold metal-dependent hydrolase
MTADFYLPPGACDCHVHVVGNMQDYPMVVERQYTPGPASVDDLRQHMARNDLQHAIIVQPSFYGSDNRCMLQALLDLAGAGRGVAVLDRNVSDTYLHSLSAQGVRGLRLNIESSNTGDAAAVNAALNYWAERIAEFQWHIQIYASLDALSTALPVLQHLRVPIVLDHFAMVQDTTAPDDARFLAVLALVQSGRAYVKLSAPYRIQSQTTPSPQAVAHIAARYLHANPERVLWGSDWPHTQREPGRAAHQLSVYRRVEPSILQQGIESWLADAKLREQVMVQNPAQLYGF